jgi:tetratricopeptide (TPR) repeat protein
MPKKPRSKLTRKEQRDLDVEIGFLEGVVHRDPKYVEALQVLGDNYTRRGKFTDGMQIDERLSRLLPNDPTVLYNLACSYSLTKRVAEAASTLTRALDRGYKDFKWLLKDPDLQNLREHELFEQIRTRIRSNRVKIQ